MKKLKIITSRNLCSGWKQLITAEACVYFPFCGPRKGGDQQVLPLDVLLSRRYQIQVEVTAVVYY